MSISKDCKLFKDCPHNWDCLVVIALYGSTGPWSLELCYDLAESEKQGLVQQTESLIDRRIHFGMIHTFYGTIQEFAANETKVAKA